MTRKHLPWILTLLAFAAIVGPPVASQTNIANNAAEMVGKIVMLADGATGRTVTNLFTFTRNPNPPFAVSAGSAKVSNLDADLLDGVDSTGFVTTTTLYPLVRNECGLRLTLTSGTPITTADVTAATSVFVTPTHGGLCSFSDGSSAWTILQPSETTITLGADAASTPYDVFCYNNSGTMACERLAWTNDTTRATALVLQQNVWSKSGALTRRYIGTYRTTTVVGQTEDSFTKRLVWSYYHRRPRELLVQEAATTWNYSTATIRCVNTVGACTNQVAVVVGVADVPLNLTARSMWSNAASAYVQIGIGEDSTTTINAKCTGGVAGNGAGSAAGYTFVESGLGIYPAAGYHFYAQLESSAAVPTTAWYGTTTWVVAGKFTTGLTGWIEG